MIYIEPLSPRHNRRGFLCGEEALDHYLDKLANQHSQRNISKTFVLVDDSNPTVVIGYYSLALCGSDVDALPTALRKKLPSDLFGGKVGRLAVAETYQGKGYGEYLLLDAMRKFSQASQSIGMVALFVDAKNEEASHFYQKYGFERCSDDPLHLYLPTKAIISLGL